MNDTLGDDPGQNDIPDQDLISDDVASAITSALNGDDSDERPPQQSSSQPAKQSVAGQSSEPYKYTPHPSARQAAPAQEDTKPDAPKPQPPADEKTPGVGSDKPEITDRGSGNVSELYDIKQEALKQLSPLVEHLEQSPEEKFDTLIMMLRASDDPALIRPVYEAAQAIEDDKARAQALLDVVNEVNYLTRPTDSDQ